MHSLTKYMGGHSDSTGGVAVGSPELMARVRAAVPVLILFVFLQRYVIQGVASSGLK